MRPCHLQTARLLKPEKGCAVLLGAGKSLVDLLLDASGGYLTLSHHLVIDMEGLGIEIAVLHRCSSLWKQI